jgi:hypothetical protein
MIRPNHIKWFGLFSPFSSPHLAHLIPNRSLNVLHTVELYTVNTLSVFTAAHKIYRPVYLVYEDKLMVRMNVINHSSRNANIINLI